MYRASISLGGNNSVEVDGERDECVDWTYDTMQSLYGTDEEVVEWRKELDSWDKNGHDALCMMMPDGETLRIVPL